MKKPILKTLSLLIALIVLTAVFPAQAAGTLIIKIDASNPKEREIPVENICLRAYLVARGNHYGTWRMVDAFSDIKVFTKDPNDNGEEWIEESMEEIQKRIFSQGIHCSTRGFSDASGIVRMTGLTYGIYFIIPEKLPPFLKLNPMMLAVPDSFGNIVAEGVTKGEYNPKYEGDHFTWLDEYETALGLGNIQIHVGVCYE